MSRRLSVTSAPGPLEDFATAFDDLFERSSQREAFRRYLEGLLLPTERNKTLTALANTEPTTGATKPQAQKLQWFLSESTWDPDQLNQRRLALLFAEEKTAPHEAGVLAIDETGDRKWGSKTAHVGRQYLGSIGKIDNGVVSVSSLWADELRYWAVAVKAYTPAHHFEKGKADEAFRSKPELALGLVKEAVAAGVPFRAVVADNFYGEHRQFRDGLRQAGIAYVLTLKPSHTWWHHVGEIGSVEDVARAEPFAAESPGGWVKVVRRFRDGHEEIWWALEGWSNAYSPERRERLVIVRTDPATLPDRATWYLVTNLPAPDSQRAQENPLSSADLAEIVRLYGLRVWVEQSYKQVKGVLGWAEYQVRSDLAIRRHWTLVFLAFSFCWWVLSRTEEPLLDFDLHEQPGETPASVEQAAPAEASAEGEKKLLGRTDLDQLAGGAAAGAGLAGAVRVAATLLAGMVREGPAGAPAGPAGLALDWKAALPLLPMTTNYC